MADNNNRDPIQRLSMWSSFNVPVCCWCRGDRGWTPIRRAVHVVPVSDGAGRVHSEAEHAKCGRSEKYELNILIKII